MSRHARWLMEELPGWVREGVIPADAAERLRQRYEGAGPSGRRLALGVCGILGAMLMGSGLILLLAHNWEALSRGARTVLSLAPLLTAQAMGAWVLATGRRGAAWRESVGAFHVMAIGASISLISQTYHLGGDFGAFMLTWCLLALPLPYLLDAALPLVLYLAGGVAWCVYTADQHGPAAAFWALAALALPWWIAERRRNPCSGRAAFVAWALCTVALVGAGATLRGSIEGAWIPVYAGLVAILYHLGARLEAGELSAWRRPFTVAGTFGVCVVAFVFSFEDVWDSIGHGYGYHLRPVADGALIQDLALVTATVGGAVWLLVTGRDGERRRSPLFGALPLLAVAAYGSATILDTPAIATVLFNVYVLALGLRTIGDGVRRAWIGRVNGGMLILSTLFIARFFDQDLSLLSRGIGFIAVGAGFLATNVVLAVRWKDQRSGAAAGGAGREGSAQPGGERGAS